MNAIATYNLCKQYKNVLALNNVSITVKKGEIYGLIGKNGAGKTTLMRILCGLTAPTAGSFSIMDQSDPAMILQSRAKLSAIIESPALYKNFNARENLQIMALLKGIDKNSPKIGEMLQLTGINPKLLGGKVKTYSLGMCQRLAIAMAMLSDPEILILDEPSNGLDPEGIKEIRDLLRQINKEKGVTILISSHILHELSQLATVYGIIDRGMLIEEISAKELESKTKKTLSITLSDKNDIQSALNVLSQFGGLNVKAEGDTLVIEGENIDELASKINMALAKAEIMIKGMSAKSTDLEDYFLSRTRR